MHVHHAGIASVPENYEERTAELYPGHFKNIRLFVLDPYDLVLSKISRNAERDREDVAYLARTQHLDPNVLGERYEHGLKAYVIGPPERTENTLKFWIEALLFAGITQYLQRLRSCPSYAALWTLLLLRRGVFTSSSWNLRAGWKASISELGATYPDSTARFLSRSAASIFPPGRYSSKRTKVGPSVELASIMTIFEEEMTMNRFWHVPPVKLQLVAGGLMMLPVPVTSIV